ncbi:trypsin eta-like [Cydia pomonella]|uniref:trypsin eta-like n=1 Tax=Cydia pomonella TaxID=82600 RepID=UPI002ADE1A2D|nr:trypsin eta-like [Cydia pomonella]
MICEKHRLIDKQSWTTILRQEIMAVRLLIVICGLKLVIGKQEGFIVGGDYVQSVTDYPHVALLSIVKNDGSESFCGSSILNQIILLTVAHCFDDVVRATALAGSLDRKKGKLYRIDRYRQHKQWQIKNVINDIALVRLKIPLSFGKTVKRVIVMKNPPKAIIAEVAGWGATDEDYLSETNLLKHTKQKLWSNKECREVLPKAPQGTICGGERRSKKDFASNGDSGSGLVVNKNFIIGLVSFKLNTVSRSLVVYTHVPYFYDWIFVESKRLACSE